MGAFIKANGIQALILKKVVVYKNGPLVPGMMVSGKTMSQMAMGDSYMPMEMCMKVCGIMIWLKASGFTSVLTVTGMLVNGRMISKMVKVLKYGPMNRNMKGTMLMGKKMERESLFGKMAVFTMASFSRIT